MKKIILIFVIISVLCLFVSCKGKKNKNKDDNNNNQPPEVKIADNYNINYYLFGGRNSANNNLTYTKEELPVALENPSKGKTAFLGWYDNIEFNGDPIIMIEVGEIENINLYAKWDDNDQFKTITYNLDGGSFEGIAPNQYEVGYEAKLTTPIKEGYNFVGWSVDKKSSDYLEKISNDMNKDLNLFANWEEKTIYNIKYDFNGGCLITEDFTSLDEFIEFFWNEVYAWSGSKLELEEFKSKCLSSWSNGQAGIAKIYKEDGEAAIDNKYFVNSNGNEAWVAWMNAFDAQVKKINKDQTAWGDSYVGYVRLNALLTKTGSYWTEEKVQAVYSSIKKPINILDSYDSTKDNKLIPITIDNGRDFSGWFDASGNKVDVIKAGTKGDLTLTAHFTSGIPVEKFEIANIPTRIKRLVGYTLETVFTPLNATYQKLEFKSSNNHVCTISDKGVIKGMNEGTCTIYVKVFEDEKFDISFDVTVYVDPYIDIVYGTTSVVEPENTIKLNATAYGVENKKVLFKSLNEDIATVDENGVVTGIKTGYADIVAYLEENDKVSISCGITVIPYEESDILGVFARAHNPEINLLRNVNVAYQYLTDVYVSASDLLYNWKYNVNRSYEAVQAGVSSNHGGKKTSTEFICVHYTAGYQSSSTGAANADYFASGGGGTSIHYTTGNDGIFSCLDDSLVGWHAGDGTSTKFEWIDTGVVATENVKPVWGVIKNSASSTGYYFTLNGQATTITVPITGTRSNGDVVTMTDPSKCFTYFGPAWKVENGKYYMGTTWACFTQRWEGAISSRGGNNNSIGIETACNKGSDLWLTYQYTAQLIAHLMDENNLDITRVVGHNMFSGKDCPQTLLYDDAYLWPLFIECVEAEYELYENFTKNGNYTITCKSNNPTYLADNGRIKGIPFETTTVNYTVTVTNNDTGETKTATFSSVIHGVYTEH